jgi:hypothetical protein
MNESISGEAYEERVKRARPDIVQRTKYRDSPQRLTVEYKRVMGPARVLNKLRGGSRTTANDHNSVTRE